MPVPVIALAGTLLMVASQTGGGGGSAVIDQIARCRAVADGTKRLACYDAAADTLETARKNKDLVVLDRTEVQATRRSLFGFPLPKIRLFGGGDGEDGADAVKQLDGKVRGVTAAALNRWVFQLEDGTRWITTENDEGYPPRVGETVVIRRAALGSYAASFNKRRSLKARRIE